MIYSIWNIFNKFDYYYIINTDKSFLIGDLIKINNDFFIIKSEFGDGKEIKEKITYIGNLFSNKTLMFQSFMVNYYYSRYFKIFSLFIGDAKYIYRLKLPLIKRQKTNIKGSYISKYKNFETYEDYLKVGDDSIKVVDYSFFNNYIIGKKQNLFVFPDLWTLTSFEDNIKFNYTIFNSLGTNLYKTKLFFDIKMGKEKNIWTTRSGVFQDWKNLENIFIFDPYKWYYKNQQNPRYSLVDIAKQIKFFYQAKNLYYVII